MKILVTGATGFVGSVLVPELLERYGRDAVSTYVLPGDRIPSSWDRAGIRIFSGDITDADALRAAFAGHSHIVHLAGAISYWKGDAGWLKRVNVAGAGCVVVACLDVSVERLVHISSVGAIGFHKDGRPADESTPFNWPRDILYMVSKRRGQDIVENAFKTRGLPAVILNPASIMGPGDHNPDTPHNELYRRICSGCLLGSFSGGLAVVDVRDLVSVILKALEGWGRDGESYLVVGANLLYAEVIRMISQACGRKAYPFPIPSFLLAAAGGLLETISRRTARRPLLTAAYGRLSGWKAYYDNTKSRAEFGIQYLDIEKTIRNGWEYFRDTFGAVSP